MWIFPDFGSSVTFTNFQASEIVCSLKVALNLIVLYL